MEDSRSRKLWEEMTDEERAAVYDFWEKEAQKYRKEVEERFWESQNILKLLRYRPGVECVTLNPPTPCEVSKTLPPQEPGHYLWYVLDWGYLDVGMVQVTKDAEKHLAYLKEEFDKGSRGFLVYQNNKDEALTMYHEAHDHLPHRNKDGVPWVDGYIPMSFDVFK